MSAPTTQNRFGCLGVFVIIVLLVSVLINVLFFMDRFDLEAGGSKKFKESVIHKPTSGVKTDVVVIRLDGIIASSIPGVEGDSMVDDLKLQLKQALEDDSIKAIVLAVDSPGGEVTASDIIFEAVRKAREKKPVVISMGSMAASGGYYVAMGGSYVMAHDTTFTGSIGVIMSWPNFTDAMGKVGMDWVTIKSGGFKDMMSTTRKLRPEEYDYVQGMVMQTYDKFVGIVAAERKLDLQMLKSGPADGRVISGKDALALKLIDGIGDLDAAILKAAELAKVPGSGAVKYEMPKGLARYLKMVGEAEPKGATKIELNLGLGNSLQLKPGYQYMVPSMLAP